MPHNRLRTAPRDNLILFVVGRKGSGKTSLVLEIAAEYPRVFVLDTMEEYEAEQGFEVVRGFEACAMRAAEAKDERKFRLSLRVDDVDDGLALVEVVHAVGDCLLIVEETAFYCSPSYLPPQLSKLVRTGRHAEVSQVYVTQRPAAVNRDLSAAADVVVAFQTHEPRDLKYFRERAGEAGERVRDLPRFKVLAFGDVSRAPLAVIERLDTRERGA